jgi:hypothetical protein
MKILVVGKSYVEGFALHIAEALSKMDHSVRRFEPAAKSLALPGRLEHWLGQVRALVASAVDIFELFGAGTAASSMKGWAGASDRNFELVPASTLDTVLRRRFPGKRCLFVVDIEGSERRMLRGAASYFSADRRPVWLVETAISEHQPDAVATNPHMLSTFQIFSDRGYETFTADEQLPPARKDEVTDIVATYRGTLSTHNFLFIDCGSQTDLFGA